jgi:hypothetical protein
MISLQGFPEEDIPEETSDSLLADLSGNMFSGTLLAALALGLLSYMPELSLEGGLAEDELAQQTVADMLDSL